MQRTAWGLVNCRLGCWLQPSVCVGVLAVACLRWLVPGRVRGVVPRSSRTALSTRSAMHHGSLLLSHLRRDPPFAAALSLLSPPATIASISYSAAGQATTLPSRPCMLRIAS